MKNIRPKIIPVLLESQVLTMWWWKNTSAWFYGHCTVCTEGVVIQKVSENAPSIQGPRTEKMTLESGVRCCRGGGCEEVDGSEGQANFYCTAKSTAVAMSFPIELLIAKVPVLPRLWDSGCHWDGVAFACL